MSGLGGQIRVNPPEHGAGDDAIGTEHDLAIREGFDRGNTFHFFDLDGQGLVIRHGPAVPQDDDMRIYPENLALQILLETAHHGQDHYQGHNPQGNAGQRNHRDQRDEGLPALGLQIPPTNEGLNRQSGNLSKERSYRSGRICGKRITSLIEAASVKSMTRRSTPTPSPAAGGMPYISART